MRWRIWGFDGIDDYLDLAAGDGTGQIVNNSAVAFNEEYFIHIQGEQKGPYTFPQLKRLYEKSLIPEETLYWQDGMEQLQPVSDLCGARRRSGLRKFKHLRVLGAVLVGVVAMVTAYCAPVFKDGWREMNDHDQTPEAAYWRARGFVREEVKRQDGSVAFEPFATATVTLTGTEATVILPGLMFGKDGAGEKKAWKVVMTYDGGKREWGLPGR